LATPQRVPGEGSTDSNPSDIAKHCIRRNTLSKIGIRDREKDACSRSGHSNLLRGKPGIARGHLKLPYRQGHLRIMPLDDRL